MNINKKPLIIVASIIGTIALLVILTPPVTSILLTRTLYEAGADQVELGDVDINPLVGTARVHDLVVRKDGTRVLALDFGYINIRIFSLFKKKLEIDQVILQQGYVDLVESDPGVFGIRGLAFPSEPEVETQSTTTGPSEWTFGVHEVDVESTALNLQAIKANSLIQADKLLISKVYTWDKDGISELILDGRFNEGRFTLNTQLSPLAKLPKVTGRLELKSINLSDIHPWIAEQVAGLAGFVNLNSTVDIARQSDADWILKLKPTLNTEGLKIQHTDLTLDSQSISYDGEPTLSISITDESFALAIEDQGQLAVQNTTASAAGHSINTEKLDWNGAYLVSLYGDDNAPEISANGEVLINSLSVIGPGNVNLATIGTTSVKDIDYQFPMSIAAQVASVNNAQLLQAENKKPVIDWDNINIKGISVSPSLAHLQNVSIRQLGVRVQRNKDGSLYLPLPATGQEEATQKSTESNKVTKTGDSAAMGIRIDRLNIAKGSLIEISDTSVKPAYTASIVFNTFAIQNINSSNINQAASIDINATVNRYAQVATSGFIKPFMEIPDTQLKTSISGVNLTRVSPYSQQYSGYQISNGSMNLESDLKIQNNNIDETVKLKLSNLELEVVNSEKAAETDARLAIGLPAALNMLKDSNDDIKLNLPIQGDLSDPDFDFSHAITVVVSKALTKGATAYAAYALQPWGAALLVKDVAGKMVTQVKLDPIVYEPSSKELPEQAPLYLEKIAGLMKDRPGIELKICARATEADRLVIARKILEEKKYLKKNEPTPEQAREVVQDTALIELAQGRMFTIKDTLIEQHQIQQDRLQTCLPKLDPDAEAKPLVELQI